MLASHRQLIKLVSMISCITLLAGCLNLNLGESKKEPVPTGVIQEGLTCSDVTLSAQQGQPLDEMTLSVVPDGFTELLAIKVVSRKTENEFLIPALRNEGEPGATFQVPVHPDGKIEGGEVTMALIDGDTSVCELDTFTIEPLEKSPGAYAKLVELIDQLNEAQKKVLSEEEEEEETNLKVTFPGKMIDEILHGENNPDSLDKMIDGESPATEDLSAVDWDLIDSLVEKSEILDEMQELLEDVNELADGIPPVVEEQPKIAANENEPPTNQEKKPIGCRGSFYKPTAAQLSTLMQIQGYGDEINKYNQVMDKASALLGAGTVLATGVGWLPVAGILGAIGTGVYAVQTLAGAVDGLLPSEMTSLEIDYDPIVFLEDDVELTGAWENAQLMTKSKGYNVGAAVLGTMLQVSGTKALKGLDTTWMKKFNNGQAVGKTMTQLQEFNVNSYTETVIKESTNDSKMVEIPPCDFGPTDITDEEWSKGEFIDAAHAPVVMTSHGTYEAVTTGVAYFLVEPIQEKFGGKTMIKKSGIKVAPIQVTIDPTSSRGDPGEVAVFTATVEDAMNKDVKWTISPQGGHQFSVTDDGNGVSTITIQTSKNPDDFPATVRVESTSTTGLRGLPDAPPRFAEALLGGTHVNVEITPEYSCVQPNERLSFGATSFGSDNDTFTWSSSGGRISQDGVFTAPNKAGSYTVKATSNIDPQSFATAEVTVGSCTCWNELLIKDAGGNERYDRAEHIVEMVPAPAGSIHKYEQQITKQDIYIPFSVPRFYKNNLGSRIVREGKAFDGSLAQLYFFVTNEGDGGTGLQVLFPKNAGPKPGETGSFQAEIMGHTVQTEAGYYYDIKESPVTVHIEEFNQGKASHEASIKGSIEGKVQVYFSEELSVEQFPDDLQVDLSLTFRGVFSQTLPAELRGMDRTRHDKWDPRPERMIGCVAE